MSVYKFHVQCGFHDGYGVSISRWTDEDFDLEFFLSKIMMDVCIFEN